MKAARRVLVICRHSAAAGTRAREALDIGLAFGAFDQQVTVLFTGEGVWNLVAGQSGDSTRSMERLLGALPDYGIGPLLADAGAISTRGIAGEQMVAGCRLIDRVAMAALIDTHDLVYTA